MEPENDYGEMDRQVRYRFRANDHPCAGGREPEPGDVVFPILFPLEGGGYLKVEIGLEGMLALADMLDQARKDLESET